MHIWHGHLVHEFLSPLTKLRTDRYGGGFGDVQRSAFAMRMVEALRGEWPNHLLLFASLWVTDWIEGGWDLDESIRLLRMLRQAGVDLIDCSSGSIAPESQGLQASSFQVQLAAGIREGADISTGAVGLITVARQAEDILATGHADLIFLAKALLLDPFWPLRAEQELEKQARWPSQYSRTVSHLASK